MIKIDLQKIAVYFLSSFTINYSRIDNDLIWPDLSKRN